MHPVLTTVHVGARELPIASYGVLLACALMVGALGTLHAARQPSGHGQAIELGALISALGLAISFGFAGAWAVHAMAQVLRSGSLSAAWSQPGISVLGALLGGAAAVIWSARALNFSALQLLDRAVPWVALAQAIGAGYQHAILYQLLVECPVVDAGSGGPFFPCRAAGQHDELTIHFLGAGLDAVLGDFHGEEG